MQQISSFQPVTGDGCQDRFFHDVTVRFDFGFDSAGDQPVQIGLLVIHAFFPSTRYSRTSPSMMTARDRPSSAARTFSARWTSTGTRIVSCFQMTFGVFMPSSLPFVLSRFAR